MGTLKEIEGRYFKECNVVMLPTNRHKNAIISRENRLMIYSSYHHYKNDRKWHTSKYYNLYITSDDEIKEGDWFYSTFNDHQPKIQQRKGDWKTCFNQHKIIATTDKSLINKTPSISYLPQPSKSFIEKYCKLRGINEVMVEYEILNISACNCDDLTCPNSYWNGDDYSCSKTFDNGKFWKQELKLKINKHNEITIHLVKDSWSREEVELLLFNFENRPVINPDLGVKQSRKDFIKENLWVKELKQ